MDMGTGKTDKLIAAAIAALPYSRPSAGFRARVLAAIEAQAAADARLAWVMKGIGAVTAAWAGAVVLVSAGPAYSFLSGYAAIAAGPGGAAQALRLLAARGTLLLAKLAAAGSVAADLAGLAAAQLPPVYEVAAAAVISAAVIRMVTGSRPAAQRI